jgi:hypothetical protein
MKINRKNDIDLQKKLDFANIENWTELRFVRNKMSAQSAVRVTHYYE